MNLPGELVIAMLLIAFLSGGLIGDKIGYWFGVMSGYGATMWPDSPYFAKARRLINKQRQADGLNPLEESVEC
jgi:membrane protein DedA with SNARE-associated domain